jgi:TPP-dependent pyruvate/acetoin dehydrogenase alpha subunit
MSAAKKNSNSEEYLRLYRQMVRIRVFEDHANQLYLSAKMPGLTHMYSGQEAVAVGICDALRQTDWITSTHRPHGHALAKGVTPRAAMAELYGKSTGCCAGKGGSMHLGDPAVGMLPALAIVGAGNTVVTGLGLAFVLRRSDQVAVCFFGDGASNEGAFHEGMNFAAVRRLPIVFVCENNLYGASTPFDAVSALVDVADRAAAYGIPGRVVDGMDVLAVREAGAEAVASARAGDGPTLLECKTYRFVGHSRSDARGYRADDEEASWKERDPIPRLRAVLAEQAAAAIEREVEAAIEDAVEFARASPDADPQEARTDVYA